MMSSIEISEFQSRRGPEFTECPICRAKRVCTACKGGGRLGYFPQDAVPDSAAMPPLRGIRKVPTLFGQRPEE
jgi:hypothetical protein